MGSFLSTILLDNNDDHDGDNDEEDETNEEADPSLFARRARRLDGLFGVLQAAGSVSVRRNENCPTYPTSVSFSTPAAWVSITWIVSSCCSTRTLIYFGQVSRKCGVCAEDGRH